ncbi:hypothetical protein B0H34DRAFT_798390 [Crassisporium funariophilum]|nr:hypothetical protein B0H34DRAFT_798390 [Crassisporium funariophilum]
MSSTDLLHHGVNYEIPAGGSQEPIPILLERLRVEGTKFIRIQWVDMVNNIRSRVVPLAYFAKILKTSRPGVSLVKTTLGLVFITIVEGFGPCGEYLYAVDLSSLRRCPYAPGHASVMGWFEEKTPIAGLELPRALEVDLCPRTILRRVVDNAKRLSGVEFLLGFESEFILLKNTCPIEAVNDHGWSISAALATGTTAAKVLEEIALALEEAGVELQMYHSEAAPGQYEVVTGPLSPLQAVDALIHTRETIYNIASKHGLRATLAPRVYMDNCGTGCHSHFSVHTTSGTPRPSSHTNLNQLEASFLAGVLEHLPELTLLAVPISASYKRMVDGVWSGGTYVCWGTDNKETPIRVCNAQSPSSRNFELKIMDGVANPYLAMAGVLGAGSKGILEGKELKIQDCKDESAASLGSAGRAAKGISDRLPVKWEDARHLFEESAFVESLFGKEFKTKYLAANKLLTEKMTSVFTDEEELKLLVETY